MKKRIISVICCLAVSLLSIPFSVSSETKSVDFEMHTFYEAFVNDVPQALTSTYYGIGFVPFVIDNTEARDFVAQFCYRDVGNLDNSDGFIDYLESLDDDFFAQKTVLMIAAHGATDGNVYEIKSVKNENNTLFIDMEYSALGVCDVVESTIILFEMDKAQISNCNSIINTVTEKKDDIQTDLSYHVLDGYMPQDKFDAYDAEKYEYFSRHINPYYSLHSPAVIVQNFEELENCRGYFVSEDFDTFANSLDEAFFETTVLVISYTKSVYSPAVYEFSRIEGNCIYYAVDESQSDRNAAPVEQHNILITEFTTEDFKQLEENHTYGDYLELHVFVERINVLGDIYETGYLEPMDYILLKRAYFGTYQLDEGQKKRADINGNGKLDAVDYILIKRAWFDTYDLFGDVRYIIS